MGRHGTAGDADLSLGFLDPVERLDDRVVVVGNPTESFGLNTGFAEYSAQIHGASVAGKDLAIKRLHDAERHDEIEIRPGLAFVGQNVFGDRDSMTDSLDGFGSLG